ncbi:hypothetical protein JCM33374_g1232 [Metschnikowia sp. JCM 33374]|nr:hypothetical protein JCM33374_g1232 [Metschnikowia sp. JCM 33374]
MAESAEKSSGIAHVLLTNPLVSEKSGPLAVSPLSSSSSSSFVPVDSIQEAIQLIDEHKHFNEEVLDYITAAADATHAHDLAAGHKIISVFGSQSTGKSTLLNALFNTSFGVMDEINRQQTTKGIWLALSPGVSHGTSDSSKVENDAILVMDVEGTDGRERGEDQDFERKAALFAMATSEVLIVNLWETQVGLYQGANMGLLKTVFEVNLSLFGTAKLSKTSGTSDHKVLLLFVIRDHLGVTPKESLAATITQDLLKIWANLNKPAEVAHLAFSDFFDLAFHTLGHKVLQPEKFAADVKLLGNRIVDPTDKEYLFKPCYHHDIPIEGWTMYAESCWEQIDSNKDLDLPTQQILVAKFKCDEIVASCYTQFLEDFDPIKTDATTFPESGTSSAFNFQKAGSQLTALKEDALNSYDRSAAKYNQSVYKQRRTILDEKINAKLAEILSLHSKRLLGNTIKQFAADLSKKPRKGSFTEAVASLTNALKISFAENLAFLSLKGELSTSEYVDALDVEVAKIIKKQQVVELNNIVGKHVKKLSTGLKTILSSEISNPSEYTWDHVMEKFETIHNVLLEKYTNEKGVSDFGVGATEEVNHHTSLVLQFKSWETLLDVIHKFISKDNLLNVLKERFDDKFRYDSNGLPRLYQTPKELDGTFGEAKNYAMKIFPILTSARLADGSEITPKVDIHDKSLKRKYEAVNLDAGHEDVDDKNHIIDTDSENEDEENEKQKNFADILNEKEKTEVLSKFKKEIDAKYVETKRSIIQHVTQIPYYIYLVILVLGWNEFMAVLRNPFFFTLLLVLGGVVYGMYQTNLLGPALVVAQRSCDEAVLLAKQKLREFVIDDHETHSSNLKKMGETTESIELDDLQPQSEESE